MIDKIIELIFIPLKALINLLPNNVVEAIATAGVPLPLKYGA